MIDSIMQFIQDLTSSWTDYHKLPNGTENIVENAVYWVFDHWFIFIFIMLVICWVKHVVTTRQKHGHERGEDV